MFEHIHHDIPKLERDTAADGSRVYRTPSGNAYPSVTTVTGLLGKESIIAWRKRVGEAEANRISTTAAKRGTRVQPSARIISTMSRLNQTSSSTTCGIRLYQSLMTLTTSER